MLNAVDNGIGNVTKALQAAGMWDDTLIVCDPLKPEVTLSFETSEPKLTERDVLGWQILTSDNGGSCGLANEPKHPDCKVCPVAGGEPAPPPGFWTEPANVRPCCLCL